MGTNPPYENERQARDAARSAIPPLPGELILTRQQNRDLILGALEFAGVEISPFEDQHAASWLAQYEDYLAAVIRRWIMTAYLTGLAEGRGEGGSDDRPA
jgi:hypothetical protein